MTGREVLDYLEALIQRIEAALRGDSDPEKVVVLESSEPIVIGPEDEDDIYDDRQMVLYGSPQMMQELVDRRRR